MPSPAHTMLALAIVAFVSACPATPPELSLSTASTTTVPDTSTTSSTASSPTTPEVTSDPNESSSTTSFATTEFCETGEQPYDEVPAIIDGDLTLGCEIQWDFPPEVRVRNGTLRIESGSRIRGTGSRLIIEPSGELVAVGTANLPTVFEGFSEITMLGNSVVNDSAEQIEAGEYGGGDLSGRCGRLEFVRIERSAGGESRPALGFYGCGTGTTVDRVQVRVTGSGPGIRLSGGWFDLSRVVVSGQAQALHIDAGYSGALQYVFLQDARVTASPDEMGPLLESKSGVPLSSPRTRPTLSNFTLLSASEVGFVDVGAILLDEGSQVRLHNSIVVNEGGPQVLSLFDEPTVEAAMTGSLRIQATILAGNPEFLANELWGPVEVEEWISGRAQMNLIGVDPLLTDTAFDAPNIQPLGGSPADGLWVDPGSESLETAGFAGAVAPGSEPNWTLEPWLRYGSD